MKLICITVYVHSLHIFTPTATLSIQHCLPSTRHYFTIRHQFRILFSPLHLRCHYSLSYNLIKVYMWDVHSHGSFRVPQDIPYSWQHCWEFCSMGMSIFEHASRLKYGHHAVHLSTNLGAPIFQPPPNVDNKHVRSWQIWIRTRHRPNNTWTSTSHRTYWNTMPTNHQWTNLLQARHKPYYTTELALTYFTTEATILHCSTEL